MEKIDDFKMDKIFFEGNETSAQNWNNPLDEALL
jgi:hypothetical protein